MVILGFIAAFVLLSWTTLVVFWATVDTFSEGMFSSKSIWIRGLAVVFWIVVIVLWGYFFSHISIEV